MTTDELKAIERRLDPLWPPWPVTQSEKDVRTLILEVKRLQAVTVTMRAGLEAVEKMTLESDGVYGLHLNGDNAPWPELRTGGRFDAWLRDFDTALEGLDGFEPDDAQKGTP